MDDADLSRPAPDLDLQPDHLSGDESPPTGAAAPPPMTGGDIVEQWVATLREQAIARPYATVVVAAAAGYVLGGGLPRWAVRAASALGRRALVAQLTAAFLVP